SPAATAARSKRCFNRLSGKRSPKGGNTSSLPFSCANSAKPGVCETFCTTAMRHGVDCHAAVTVALHSEGESMAKYGKKAQSTVKSAMHRKKKGTLKSGKSGKKVKSRKQAIAIGLSEARTTGAKVPAKKSSSKKSSSKKSSSKKSSKKK